MYVQRICSRGCMAYCFVMKFVAFIVCLIFVTGAHAGNLPKLGQTGFSADGAYFSFEQYGFEDGSGFPFSSITIIDVAQNKEVVGSPFNVKIENETQPLFVARQRVQQHAEKVLQKLGISGNYGHMVANNPISQLGKSSDRMEFTPNKWVTGAHELIEISLETYPVVSKQDCSVFGPVVGFRLLMNSGGTTQVLYQDGEIPKGRFCPQSYQLDRIEVLVKSSNLLVLAIIVRAYSPGFEGQDATYLAVTKRVLH